MNKFTAPTGESPLDEDVAEVRHLLRGVRGALSTLRGRLEQDEEAAGGQTGKVLTELRHLIRTTIDTEKSFEQRQKEKDGIVNDYRLDLHDARASIERRLARLRAVRDTTSLSG
ncbi:hypothetical protein SAMN05444000_103195 [Shimia gijangensis]|uniref:Uncharacterized protein n=1 Tax=Shimia gijangensis TaxID=1470563 RepID=A0A1M6EG18_9RHOB|nr:hypothetical protein [Shimia gijangensis]SHI84238.1 hypothetical protein SAMN05444000_103195 [Shimia gijangensis]